MSQQRRDDDDNGRARPGAGQPGSVESLYPFLYSGASDLPAVLDQVRASTVAKATEIAELRAVIAERDGARLESCARQAAARFARGGRLLAFGNGGSASDAAQLATLFLNPGDGGRPLPALSLASDTPVLTALSNDIGVEVIFARQLAALGRRDDIAVALSTSGNSANLLRALEEASRRGMLTIGLAGYDGGTMAELDLIDYLFVAPSASVHRIQEAQTTIYQVLWELTLAALPHQEQHDQEERHQGQCHEEQCHEEQCHEEQCHEEQEAPDVPRHTR
jgi:D-sedoheptulose 7-phosphate isomerase